MKNVEMKIKGRGGGLNVFLMHIDIVPDIDIR